MSIFFTLLRHQWKENKRSSVFQKNIGIKLFTGLLVLYFGVIFLSLGFMADNLLAEFFPTQQVVTAFNSFLLFYFLTDLFTRFMLQELPVLAIQPYLHLPLPTGKLIHFVLLKSVTSLFNFIVLLVFVPFMIEAVIPAYGAGVAAAWLGALMVITLVNNFLLIYFKRLLTSKPLYTLLFGLAIAGLMLLDYAGVISLRMASSEVFGALLAQPWLVAVPVLLLVAVYTLNFRYLKGHLYPEELAVHQNKNASSSNFSFLDRFGITGKLIALELKLIWRHKRTKSTVFLSGIFLLYGFLFYKDSYLDGFAMLLFVGVFTTGMFMFNYGQFIPAWQSAHFDAMLTKRISPYQFYLAKFWLFIPVMCLAFLVTLPYGLISYKIILINLAALLFNMGINVFIVFYFSVFNSKRLDLAKGASFNWQGVGASNFIQGLPLLLLPLLIYAPFGFLDIPYWGVFTIGALGLVGFIFRKQLLLLTVKRFEENKYKLATGFRVS